MSDEAYPPICKYKFRGKDIETVEAEFAETPKPFYRTVRATRSKNGDPEKNEDRAETLPNKNTIMVFDGVGGAEFGREVAGMAAKKATELAEDIPNEGNPEEIREQLVLLVRATNQEIIRQKKALGMEEGYTTMTIAKRVTHNGESFIVWASVGDSPLYILNRDPTEDRKRLDLLNQMHNALYIYGKSSEGNLEDSVIARLQDVVDSMKNPKTPTENERERLAKIINKNVNELPPKLLESIANISTSLALGEIDRKFELPISSGFRKLDPGGKAIAVTDGVSDALIRVPTGNDLEDKIKMDAVLANPANALVDDAVERQVAGDGGRFKRDDASATALLDETPKPITVASVREYIVLQSDGILSKKQAHDIIMNYYNSGVLPSELSEFDQGTLFELVDYMNGICAEFARGVAVFKMCTTAEEFGTTAYAIREFGINSVEIIDVETLSELTATYKKNKTLANLNAFPTIGGIREAVKRIFGEPA